MANTEASQARHDEQATMFTPESLEEFRRKKKAVTRSHVLAMADCSTAALIVCGALSTWGVTSEAIASGRMHVHTTPTKVIVADSENCPNCSSQLEVCRQCPDGEIRYIDWEDIAEEIVAKGIA